MKLFRKKGFTLLELMIVVIIIGILASLAIPRFIVARDKAIKSEAKNMLGAIRGSQMRYFLENNNQFCVDADNDLSTGSDLDITVDPASQYFTYDAADNTDPATATYVGRATGKAATAMAGVVITIAENGIFTE